MSDIKTKVRNLALVALSEYRYQRWVERTTEESIRGHQLRDLMIKVIGGEYYLPVIDRGGIAWIYEFVENYERNKPVSVSRVIHEGFDEHIAAGFLAHADLVKIVTEEIDEYSIPVFWLISAYKKNAEEEQARSERECRENTRRLEGLEEEIIRTGVGMVCGVKHE